MDESNQDEKIEMVARYAVAMHLEANSKTGKLAMYITIAAVLISIYESNFWPLSAAVVLCIAIYFYLIQSCMRLVEQQTGMPQDLQAYYSRLYKTDAHFAKEVDEIHQRGSGFAGLLKKRVQMDELLVISQMTTCLGLMNYYGFDEAKSESEKNELTAKAAAGANYLFGKEPSPMHVQQFNILEIESEACEWLRKTPVFCELVVQSLRVAMTINYAASGTLAIVGAKLIAMFCREFPNTPNPTTFKQLVNKAILSLPPDYQQRLYKH